VSRTAVWKHINALRDEGYEIDSVKNRGYKLVSEPDLLDGKLILDAPENNLVIKRIKIMKETDSTNEEAKRIVRSGDE
ncbi:MAG: HTH domain-containing protein, partial [Treponema sp.]|nr:HTH domain-containing protein [Treponema sp.]